MPEYYAYPPAAISYVRAHYVVLEVSPYATKAEIEKAYRKVCRQVRTHSAPMDTKRGGAGRCDCDVKRREDKRGR